MVSAMVFWGATGQAKVLRECMEGSGLPLAALFDNRQGVAPPFDDVPVYAGRVGFEAWLANCEPRQFGFLVAIGGSWGYDRVVIQDYLEASGLAPLTAKHPTAFVAGDAQIGAGSQILAKASVAVEAVIGRACIVNTGASVDHGCRLDAGVHIGPGAVVTGEVTIRRYAFIGAGATIVPRVTIGTNAVVGAGAVVLDDVPAYSVVVGNPARVLRELPKHGTSEEAVWALRSGV
jgi:sugar O-acyltransferase (sialic acid O-acetyltransferase NeuD family)